ncbi:MAG: 4-alpha-glucanotransferase [Nitrospiraceae bacterium]
MTLDIHHKFFRGSIIVAQRLDFKAVFTQTSLMRDATEMELLDHLSERAGIAADYYDIAGVRHVTSDDTKRAILAAMGIQADSKDALAAALKAWEETPWRQFCDPVLIIREGDASARWSCRLQMDEGKERALRLQWEVRDEGNEIIRQGEAGPGLVASGVRFVDGRRHVRLEIAAPEGLPIGYYHYTVSGDGPLALTPRRVRLIVAPLHCYVPSQFGEGRRYWGVALQLYSVRSQSNWGVGDFSDLRRILDWAATELGAGIVGLNPLHALKNMSPHHISPYSPNSRLYLNEIYIDVERLPEFHASEDARRLLNDPEFQLKLNGCKKSDRVDYDAVAAAKRTMLDLSYRQFLRDHYTGDEPDIKPRTPRGWLLDRYIREEGSSLELFAIFQALDDDRRQVQSRSTVWPEWPQQYRSPDGGAVREFARRHRKRVRFFQYVQWVAAGQLKELATQADRLRMPIGLYQDLALGGNRCGADGWMFQDILSLGAECGAPPDAFAPEGQNWGLPPINPIRLRATGYEVFIRLLRNNLRYGGAIRVDHVMALFRLFWIPHGTSASAGTYVHYPFEDLLAILALESVRSRTLVIGEDLGTVPDWVREKLTQAKILSYRVFYFERTWDGMWKAPREYPEQSLAVATTHDLPTLSGFWSGEDIHVRAGLGCYADEQARQRALEERDRDKKKILSALKVEGLLPEGITEDLETAPVMTPALCQAVHAYLGRTSSWIVLANLEDSLGELAQTNMPGTVDSHPNWSRKLSLSMEDIAGDDRVRKLGTVLDSLRSFG